MQAPRPLMQLRRRAQRGAVIRGLLVACVLWSLVPAVTCAQGSLQPITGFGWDMELDGGVGVGLQRQLDNNFLGRLRVGALYFSEPLVYALGVTGEVGGLAEFGFGLALSVSHFDGLWARVGGSRVEGDDWMTQVTVGYLFFGAEWQHRLDTSLAARDAVMLLFRVPIGVWWFLMHEQHPNPPPMPDRVEPSSRTTEAPRVAAVSPVNPGDRLLAARLLEEATLAEQQEHWEEAATLLSRAARLDPSPLLILRLARVQRRASQLVSAADNLRRFVDAAVTPEEVSARTDAERERLEVLSQLAYLRLRVEPLADNESVWLDDQPFSIAALGYPYPIDPGAHVIVVKRGDQELVRREVRVDPGGNLTLKIDPNAPQPTSGSEASEDRAVDVGTGTGQTAQ